MNAYELEIIQATLVSQGNLIKQQADRIAELEEENRRIRERTWDSDFSRQFLAEIREVKERHNIK